MLTGNCLAMKKASYRIQKNPLNTNNQDFYWSVKDTGMMGQGLLHP